MNNIQILIAGDDGGIEVSGTDSGVGMKADKAAGIFSLSGSRSSDGTRVKKAPASACC